jgi:Tol biopolymer transport system component
MLSTMNGIVRPPRAHEQGKNPTGKAVGSRALFLRLLPFFCVFLTACTPPSPTPLATPPAAKFAPLVQTARGRIVYERNREGKNLGLFLVTLPDPAPRRLTDSGQNPRWSPEGAWLAFRRGDELLRLRPDGTGEQSLARAPGLRALAWRPDGTEIWFASAAGVQAVSLTDLTVRNVFGQKAVELDVSADGTRLVYSLADHHMYGADLPSGRTWKIGRGCSASLSPDATQVTNNRGDHKSLWLRKFDDGTQTATIPAPPGTTFDNQWWSNHPDWMASRTEQPGNCDIWLHRLSDGACFKVTATGDTDRPDFFHAPLP